jgi:probable HAF family extracellular repeat protein
MQYMISPPRNRLLLTGVLAAGLTLAAEGRLEAQAGYAVQDLGALPGDTSSTATAINANGDVVGWSMGSNGTRAFVFTSGGAMVALPGLPDRPRSVARDINDAGVVVGSANAGGTDQGHAVIWKGGGVQDLGTLSPGGSSEAYGVNNLGQVVGWSYTTDALTGVHGFLYTPGSGLVDVTPGSDTGYALDINDAGQVTGYKTAFGGYHAYRWQAGSSLDLGALPGFADSFGWAINRFGAVVGSSGSATGNSERWFRYTDNGFLQDLGGTGEHNTANGINSWGQVVGTTGQSAMRALIYTDADGLRDLNTLIDPSLGWLLLAANDINDSGQIAGRAFNNFTGLTHAVRLLPTAGPPPECTFHCMRVTSIDLSSRAVHKTRSYAVTGRVTLKDENGLALSGALVVARFTLPDGTSADLNAWTSSTGVATFSAQGGKGTYTLTVANAVLSLYTFNPSKSVLSKSLTVTK